MTRVLSIVAFMLVLPALNASPTHIKPSEYVRGTVVGIQEHRAQSPDFGTAGSNPSDAPLTTRYYAYEVSIKVDCTTYTGRYETPFRYLPSAFTRGNPIQFRLTRHVMYFDLPNNPDLRFGIIHRGPACAANR